MTVKLVKLLHLYTLGCYCWLVEAPTNQHYPHQQFVLAWSFTAAAGPSNFPFITWVLCSIGCTRCGYGNSCNRSIKLDGLPAAANNQAGMNCWSSAANCKSSTGLVANTKLHYEDNWEILIILFGLLSSLATHNSMWEKQFYIFYFVDDGHFYCHNWTLVFWTVSIYLGLVTILQHCHHWQILTCLGHHQVSAIWLRWKQLGHKFC